MMWWDCPDASVATKSKGDAVHRRNLGPRAVWRCIEMRLERGFADGADHRRGGTTGGGGLELGQRLGGLSRRRVQDRLRAEHLRTLGIGGRNLQAGGAQRLT